MPHIHELYDFTASAFILHPSEPKICLLMHRKLHKWLQPGGHVELHEDPLEALAHELIEETGLTPEDYTIIEPADQPHPRGSKTLPLPMHFNVHPFKDTEHRHIDVGYLVQSKTEKLNPQQEESQIIGWFNLDEITKMHKQGELHDGTFDICSWILEKQV
jgi:8-oxo-dGTP pyrophosphatase MutT (NUDIX family)